MSGKIKTRCIEVQIRFYKVFNIVVPEGVTEDDVYESEAYQNESSEFFRGNVDLEFDEARTIDQGYKTPEEIDRMKKHRKVFTWDEAKGDE